MRLSQSLPLLIVLSVASLAAQTSLPDDSAHFIINQGSHAVGRSDFSIQTVQQGSIATPGAYAIGSHGTLALQNTRYSFSGNGSLDRDLGILSQNLSGIVNGSAVTFLAQTTGTTIAVAISANGKTYKNSLTRPQLTVFFPDFDLASYEILLALAATHPGTPLSAFIPKQTGILSAATLAPQADVQATFNGAALKVHHSVLTIGTVVSDLYFSGKCRVLEVDIPSQTFAIVRDTFQLQQPPSPPAETGPNSQQPAGGAPQSQPQ